MVKLPAVTCSIITLIGIHGWEKVLISRFEAKDFYKGNWFADPCFFLHGDQRNSLHLHKSRKIWGRFHFYGHIYYLGAGYPA